MLWFPNLGAESPQKITHALLYTIPGEQRLAKGNVSVCGQNPGQDQPPSHLQHRFKVSW